MSSRVVDLAGLLQQIDTANSRNSAGDWGVWRELLSHRQDVAILGAYGAHLMGWEAVSARFGRTATGYASGSGGGRSTHENIVMWVGDDLACSVTVERHESGLDGGANLVPFSYRATHVFRREEDTWRIVLRHADPLVDFVGPEVAHAMARRSGG
jgi:ketosteroid isomerase-like protein